MTSTFKSYKSIKDSVRRLRKEQTDSEKILWKLIRNRKLLGLKFLRQHPIIYKADYTGFNYFIADFYCHEKKIVIELDGSVHNERKEYDQYRDEVLKSRGLKVLRIKNEELENSKVTLEKIVNYIIMQEQLPSLRK